MYAVIEIGSKQQIVKEGDSIEVERQELEVGAKLTVSEVLLVVAKETVSIGKPFVKGASVETEVLRHLRGQKLITFKYRRRKSSHNKKGHRQNLTVLAVKKIKAG
mgnify:CR=1 FL=1